MTYFRKRDNGWEYRISYKAPDGSYQQKSKSGYRTKAEAVHAASQAELDLANGIIEDKNITLAEYFKKWMEVHKKPHVGAETYAKYEYTLSLIERYFQETRLAKINATHYQKIINDMATTYVKDSVKRFNSHIRTSIKVAIHQGILKKDFTEIVKIFSDVKSKSENDKYLELEEYENLLLSYRKTIKYQSHFFLYTIGRTGLRFSECAGITKSVVDRKNMCLHIRKTFKVYGKKRGWCPTKNKQSERDVPIDTEWLKAYDEYLKIGYIDNSDQRLFIKLTGTGENKILKKSTRKTFNVHGLRHTYVSWLIYHDVDVVTIAGLVGHKDATETLKTYSHLFKAKQEQSFDKVRNLMGKFGADLGQKTQKPL
ncbi:tyrosine-type recombinase/integrase [Streptococcus azizii]|uniref:Site-specific integrase n=1 Tax=Streptococcus azizii TaxID=1579424 RepID=A0AB36JN45_9STRE|nr:tyrosine-type recombinase/integrase [Streptococcus azizii]ONK25698.1 site-specific integrase [Streptococcus azizii]